MDRWPRSFLRDSGFVQQIDEPDFVLAALLQNRLSQTLGDKNKTTMASANYKIVGKHYSSLRQPDPRIALAIHAELEGMDSIVNIGAGTGSYEPLGKQVAAVEPSDTMIAQRTEKENTVVYQVSAENLPFEPNSFDVALAILTIQHWENWQKGLKEALRPP